MEYRDGKASDLFARHSEVFIEDETPILAFPSLKSEAYFGVLKEIIDIACSNSEASPVSVAIALISNFSAFIGRDIYFPVGDFDLHCRPYTLIVGKSGKARKGTSEYLVSRIFQRLNELNSENPLAIHSGGLSSGEGIIHAIRDPGDKDLGVPDKRLLVIESEFVNVLINCKRESSILSSIIRNAFDGKSLAPLTKHNKVRATNPHIVLAAQITEKELIKRTNGSAEMSNGFLNRFLFFSVRRERLVSLPKRTSFDVIDNLANKLNDIISTVKINKTKEMSMSQDAKDYWDAYYAYYTAEVNGKIGELSSRHDVYRLMFAMIFALLDKRLIIETIDIERACLWIDYAQESIRFIYANTEEDAKQKGCDTLADQILEKIKIKPMTRTEISASFNRNKKSSELKEAITQLLNASPPLISVNVTKNESFQNRPKTSEVFTYVGA